MKNRTRLLAGLLSLLLLFTSMPAAALAGEPFVPTKKAKDGALVGDVNKNNTVDATDRMLLARYLAGWEGYEERILSMDAADIDRDGEVTAKDRMMLARFLAGWDGYEEYFTGYLVTFDGNSFDVENLPEPQTVKLGECAVEPAAPTKPIHTFTGWYTDEECTAKFDFSTPVTDDLTLYAGWDCEIYSKDLDEGHVREEEFEIDGETGTFTFVDNQLVVVVEDGVTRETLEATLSAYRGVIVGQIPDVGYYQVEFPEARAGADLQAFAEELTACAGIEEAFINLVLDYEPQYDYNPNDMFGLEPTMLNPDPDPWTNDRTWHLRATNTREAWDKVDKLYKSKEETPSIRLGVIDPGIDNHYDLNIQVDKEKGPAPGSEKFAHGTHVAGIMGAIHNNETQVVKEGEGKRGSVDGVAMGAEVIAICVSQLDWNGAAVQVSKLIDENCKVINMSIGTDILQNNRVKLTKEAYEETFKDTKIAAKKAEKLLQKQIDQGKDFLIVTSAGNNAARKEYITDEEGNDEWVYIETEYDDTLHNNFLCYIQKQEIKDRIIVVGNAEKDENTYRRHYDSSYRGGRVDVMAPGTEIWSTVPVYYNASGLAKKTGTSQAAPFVAGLAGLIWEANPDLTPERVKKIIHNTATIPVEDSTANMVDCDAAVSVAITEYYTVHFDANTGGGTMEDQSIEVVITGDFTFPECGFTPPDNCIFKCWRFNDKDYAPGEVMTINGGGSGTAQALWTSPVHGDRLYRGTFGDNVTWMLFQDGTMIVSGKGNMRGYDQARYRPYLNQLDLITSVEIQDGITSIGGYVFNGCKNLTSVSIPDSVTGIYELAFGGCTSLESVTIPNSVTKIMEGVFAGCTALSNVAIPNSVTYIGEMAFEGCTSLTSITIPESVTLIRAHAFRNCQSLKTVWFQGSAPSRSTYAGIFDKVTATAYYPAGDASWSENWRKGYGGNITWVAY